MKKSLTHEIGINLEMPLAVLSWGIFLIIELYLIDAIQSKLFSHLLMLTYCVILYVYIYKKNSVLKDSYSWPLYKGNYINSTIVRRSCFGAWRTYKGNRFYDHSYTQEFYPKITYTYEVDGTKVESDNVFLLNCNDYYTWEDALKVKNDLVKEKTVNVYVNPKNKYQSLLIRGEDGRYELSYLIALFMIISQFLVLNGIR